MRRYRKRHANRFKQLDKREVNEMQIDIWTDGSCEPNPGTGGWAAVLKTGEYRKEIAGRLEFATNNTAELTAVIKALESIKGGPHEIIIHTDSKYTQLALEGMKKPRANFQLLDQIKELKSRHRIQVEWVRGHMGNDENERCDQLARSMAVNHGY